MSFEIELSCVEAVFKPVLLRLFQIIKKFSRADLSCAEPVVNIV